MGLELTRKDIEPFRMTRDRPDGLMLSLNGFVWLLKIDVQLQNRFIYLLKMLIRLLNKPIQLLKIFIQ